MAKKKPETIVEKIADKVNEIIHPDQQKDEAAPAPQTASESKPKSAYKSEMGKHKKFSKFN